MFSHASSRGDGVLGRAHLRLPRNVVRAAADAREQLRAGTTNIRSLFEHVRNRLSSLLELPKGTTVALVPSGTDAEMLATAITAGTDERSIVNIVVGPAEVGSGTKNAAACLYYDSLTPRGRQVEIGTSINGDLASRVAVKSVAVRDHGGQIRQAAELEAELAAMIAEVAEQGDRIVLHVVTHSKTGITAPSLAFARQWKNELGEQLVIVVDAAQGRLGRRQIGELIQNGCHVIWTGSKFVGGPPFAGALLCPRDVVRGEFDFRQSSTNLLRVMSCRLNGNTPARAFRNGRM